MRLNCLAFGLLAIAFALHLVWWRIRVPRRQTAVLLGIFGGTLVFGLSCVSVMPALVSWRPDGWLQFLHVAECFVAFTLAYVVAYSAIEERSPSMTLLTYVHAAGDRGRTEEELRAVLAGMSPIGKRLQAMIRDGMLSMDGFRYRITGKGRGWARLFGTWRRMAGLSKGG